MSGQSEESGELKDAPVADPENGGGVGAECRAAYILARNIHLIDGWLFAVRRMAEVDGPRWEWSFPKTLFSWSYDVPPVKLFGEIDDALRDLAVAGRADAAILVELHRSVDAAADSCAQLAEFAKWDQLEEIRGDYCSFAYDIKIAMQLLPRILAGQHGAVDVWLRVGYRVGELLAERGYPGYEQWYLRTISELFDSAASISSADMANLRNMPVLRRDASEISYRDFKIAAQAIDEEIMRSLEGALPMDAWIVLDDQRRILTFLGVQHAIEDFSEYGGLAVLRVLMQHPGDALSTPEIVKKADLGAGPDQVAAYLSRFRSVVKQTKEQWPANFRNDPGRRLAESAFIISDARARRLAKSKDTFYKLNLPSYRVMHVPAVTPA